MSHTAGRHFLQIPGPTNVPDAVLRAIDRPTIDHRGPAFANLASDVLERIRLIFKTQQPVVIFPSSGTGAWEAALVNTLSQEDRVLMFETGPVLLAVAPNSRAALALMFSTWRATGAAASTPLVSRTH